ncbi:hypothetical protein CYQ88_09995 [Hydrogenovibrio sp. SC-1]|uniref:peptidoglycan DD-metalloendopeptidase family protein n=1 Tax=Hydrogenovibrio sp. SC-1 TaxID=2065820 RepID=UPI000C7D625A|nr:M23 family metallopeptidase [Hydrogenovibrio sp. SC-1]PLA73645.1 hypothetical protein CYQ88_09995 [Hydrogenovibrio sp. SC-1]
MLQTCVIRLLLILMVFNLIGCAPAPYRGWSEGSDYFKTSNQSKSQQTAQKATSKKSACLAPYTVRSGDTLSQIALKCGVSLSALAKENDLAPPYTLYVKQQLMIPSSAVHVEPSIERPQRTTLPEPDFAWPMSKKLQYDFVKDLRGLHGLRVFANIGEAVYAMNAGEVVYAGNGIKQYGSMLVIKHDNDYLTVYAHNDTLQVSEGARVTKKQLIATIGKTGQVLAPQLYVEVRYRGRKVDIKTVLSGL